MTKTHIGIGLAGIVVGLLFSAFTGTHVLGGVYSNSSSVGPSGTLTSSDIWTGTGTLIASTFTVAPTTTLAMDIAVAGVVSTDTFVLASFGNPSSEAYGGWTIKSAAASSTNGYVTVKVLNLTGASAIVPAALASSSVKVLVRH